jgi:hypothetical protein
MCSLEYRRDVEKAREAAMRIKRISPDEMNAEQKAGRREIGPGVSSLTPPS